MMRAELDALRDELKGVAHVPGDGGYSEACQGWNLSLGQSPAVVVVAAGPGDVVAAVRFARAQHRPVGVMATGHGLPVPCDGGVLINTGRMRDVRVDPQTRTASVGAGARWQDVLDAAHPHRLAPLSGNASHVGVVGYTLGGGLGWMLRKYGLCADSVRGASVVLADGRLVEVDECRHPDLLWALAGGGGNFGVVTELRIRLYPVAEVFGGGVYYPIERAREVFAAYREWIDAGPPPDVTSAVVLANFPDQPGVPPALRGRSLVSFRAVVAADGDRAEAERLLKPLRSLPGCVADTFRAMPYRDVGEIAMVPGNAIRPVMTGRLLGDLSQAAVDALLAVAGPGAPYAMVEVRHLDGGIAPAADRAGIGMWNARFGLIAGSPVPTDADTPAVTTFHRRLREALVPYESGTTLNLIFPGESTPERVRQAFSPEHYERLAWVKREYDPRNVFRFNHNIPPSE